MNTPTVSKPRQLVTLIGATATIVVSLAVLIGWFLDVAVLKSVLPNFPEMKPNTALAFVILGIGALCAAKLGSRNSASWFVTACGLLVCLIGAATLTEYQLRSDFGIDTILISVANFKPDNLFPGRMSPHSAFNFLLLGLFLAMLKGQRHFHKASEILVGVVLITTFGAILGHLYGAKELYGVSNFNSMALHTAVLFLICCIGLLAINTASPTVKLLTSDSLGGVTARWFAVAVIIIPTLLDRLRTIGEVYGLYDTGFGSALSQLIRVTVMCGVVFFVSTKIYKLDIRRRVAERLLAEKEQRYRELFDYGQSMICIHDLKGVLNTVNPAALNSIGYRSEDVIGKNLHEFMPEELRVQFPGFLRQIEHEGAANGSFTLIAKDGRRVVWQYQSILVSEPGRDPYVLGNAQDITKLVDATSQLKNLSFTDDLTGLHNRRGFQTLAEQQIRLERHKGTARGLTLMFADLDGLKQINDKYGHQIGSDAIKAFADVLRSALRDADIIARWGGDEFVVLTIGSPNETSEMIVDRIHERVEQYNAGSRAPYDLACSIGVAAVPPDGARSFDSLIAEADAAMYNEKRMRKLGSVAPQESLRVR